MPSTVTRALKLTELFVADEYMASEVPTQLSLLYLAQGSEIMMKFWI